MSFAQKTLKRKNVKGLALTAGPRALAPGIDTGVTEKNDRKEDSLEMGLELRLDFRNEDLIVLKELGAGNGGTVAKVQHVATKHIMARKVSVIIVRFGSTFADLKVRSYMLKQSRKYRNVSCVNWASCKNAILLILLATTARS